MTDSLQRFIFDAAPVRGEIVHLDSTWRAVLERHDYPAPLRAVLGELMAAAALLSGTLKFNGSLILQIQGSGAVSPLAGQRVTHAGSPLGKNAARNAADGVRSSFSPAC